MQIKTSLDLIIYQFLSTLALLKQGLGSFALSGASWKGLVFSLKHLGAFILVIK